MSGRERITGTGPPTHSQNELGSEAIGCGRSCGTRSRGSNALEEVGLQIDVPRAGDPTLIQAVLLLVNDNGHYAGSLFALCATSFHWI